MRKEIDELKSLVKEILNEMNPNDIELETMNKSLLMKGWQEILMR